MKRLQKIGIAVLACMVLVSGCGKKEIGVKEAVQAGEYSGQKYTNSALEIQYQLPEGWELYDMDTALEYQVQKLENTGADGASLRAAVEQGQTGFLFLATAEGEAEGELIVQAASKESLEGMPLVESANALAEQLKAGYVQGGATVSASEVSEKKLEGHDTAFFSITLNVGGEEIHQAYSLYVANGVVVTGLLTTDAGAYESGLEALNSLSFS